MGRRFDGPISLSEHHFNSVDMEILSGVGGEAIRDYERRGILPAARRSSGGYRLFNLRDALRLTTMHDLIERVGMARPDAAAAAEYLARQVDQHMGDTLDLQAIPRGLCLALARVDGEMQVGLTDATQPGALTGPWFSTHVTVPIAAVVATVAGRLLALATSPDAGA